MSRITNVFFRETISDYLTKHLSDRIFQSSGGDIGARVELANGDRSPNLKNADLAAAWYLGYRDAMDTITETIEAAHKPYGTGKENK